MVTMEEAKVIVASKDNLQRRSGADSQVHASHTDPEENAPVIPEKPSEDGYNWRKYGQKNVKGNEYIRSYYKCSYPNCQVKKQVERSQDGRITDITYLGMHDHAKPHSETLEAVPSVLSVPVQKPDCPLLIEDKPSDVHTPAADNIRPQPTDIFKRTSIEKHDTTTSSLPGANQATDAHNENMALKRQKKSIECAAVITEKSPHESRVVVHTVSEVDIVNDGYRWRKYGQKMVKGNPNPRSYYRCSTAGCPVKKHVERASHDPRVVITTYEGEHDHTVPPIRTVVPLSVVPFGGITDFNGISSKSKLQESDAAHNDLSCEANKNGAISLIVKEEINTKEMVKTEPEIAPSEEETVMNTNKKVKSEPEISPSEQETQGVGEKGDHIEPTKHEITCGQTMQDHPTSDTSNSGNFDHQSVKLKKVDLPQNMTIEVVSTEEQRSNALDRSHLDTNSNGQQRPTTEPVNC